MTTKIYSPSSMQIGYVRRSNSSRFCRYRASARIAVAPPVTSVASSESIALCMFSQAVSAETLPIRFCRRAGGLVRRAATSLGLVGMLSATFGTAFVTFGDTRVALVRI
jgi:hypothetical protein